MMRKVDYVVAIVLGLFSAAALFTRASQAPASYIGNFTAPWFAQIGLFLAVLVTPAVLWLRLDRFATLHESVWFIALLPFLAGGLGVYMAVRFVIEKPTKTAEDWIIIIGGTIVYAASNAVLLYGVFKSRK
jgi:hypothetical protein